MRHKTKLIRHEEIAEGTMVFHFEKPAGYEYKAGQASDFTLPEIGETHTFSLASAPHEPDIMIATRMRDTKFKNTLKNLAPGAEVEVLDASGDLILHADPKKPAVFLAGGIGITPFRSIILDAREKNKPHPLVLFYSNRRPEDATFLSELETLTGKMPDYTFVGTMTDMGNSKRPWGGETGYITEKMLRKYLPDLSTPTYYMAGPQTFVAAMRKMLNGAGVLDDFIRTEEFSGY